MRPPRPSTPRVTIQVLVIDGSSTCAALVARLAGKSGIEVIAAARDAAQARELIRTLRPDVITLDLETPGINGLEFLEKIMRLRPAPVIVVSELEGGDLAGRALTLGAVDCYAKSGGFIPLQDDGARLAHLIRQVAKVTPRTRGGFRANPDEPA